MFIKVKEIKKYVEGRPNAEYDTLVNTDNIEYIRYDDCDGYLHFKSGDYILVNAESSKRVEVALYGAAIQKPGVS